MQACDRDPAAFRDALRETATRYHRVAIFKYWHTCCDRCLAQEPVLEAAAHECTLRCTVNAGCLSCAFSSFFNK